MTTTRHENGIEETKPTEKKRIWNNVLLNFNKEARYPEILYRSGGSVSFRSKSVVYMYKDNFLSEEEEIDINNTKGFYPMACTENCGLKESTAVYNLITHYKNTRINFSLNVTVLKVNSNGEMYYAYKREDIDEIRPYISDLGKSVSYKLKDHCMDIYEGDFQIVTIKPSEAQMVDGILPSVPLPESLKPEEEKPTFWDKVWKVIYGVDENLQRKEREETQLRKNLEIVDSINKDIEMTEEWYKKLTASLDLTSMVYDQFKTLIYEPTRNNHELTSKFMNKLIVFNISIDPPKKRVPAKSGIRGD